jgi:integrase
MARRSGQIIQRGPNKFQIRVFLGYKADGRRDYSKSTVYGTKKDAEKALTKRLNEIHSGTFIKSAGENLNKLMADWLTSVRPTIAARTADGYEAILKRYYVSSLGARRVDSLRSVDFQKIITDLHRRGLNPQTIRHAHTIMRAVVKHAVDEGVLMRNFAEQVKLPKMEKARRAFLTPEQCVGFLQSCADAPHGLVFEFTLMTGRRPEEYLAVRWSDVHLVKGTVTVQGALVRHKSRVTFESPKTKSSNRTISLPDSLLPKLAAHHNVQAEKMLLLGSEWQRLDLVFCSEFGTPLSIPNLTYRYFRPILKKAGLPQIRLYDLRHSQATLLLAADEHPQVVSERLGHSTIKLMLDTYTQHLPNLQKRASEKLDQMLYGEVRTPLAPRKEKG